VSSTFPRARASRPGYNVDQVEDFLEDARKAYSAEPSAHSVVTAEIIRRMAFDMQKGGYSTSHVDAALERLEDAFAGRERDRAFAPAGGDTVWYAGARGSAQVILDRLARPAHERFHRVGRLSRGYDVNHVDAFAERLVDYFQHGKPMSIDEVRLVAFPVARHGYSESQVDCLIDDVVDVMLAVR
jgi:DivIVA domain-containing protein